MNVSLYGEPLSIKPCIPLPETIPCRQALVELSGDKMEIVYVTVLAAGSFLTLFVLDKLMGHRQISQMSFFDYVVGITIGSIAAEMATNLDKSWYYGVIAMSVYAAIEILLSFLSRKSTKARKFLFASPNIHITNGI